MGTGLQSTAAWGRGKSRARRQGGESGRRGLRYQASAGAGRMGSLGIPLPQLPSLSLHDLAAVVRQREGNQHKGPEKRKSPEKRCLYVRLWAHMYMSLTDTVYR